jgi:anti-sigma regulatory factor (Ser/Thr protein kinase)
MPSIPLSKVQSLELPDTPSSVALARAFVVSNLEYWSAPGPAIEEARLLVSELTTNALHPNHVFDPDDARIWLQISSGPDGRLRIEVRDHNPKVPEMRNPSVDDENGRGLVIIDALSTNWGHFWDEGAKTVWAELDCAASLYQDKE